jgi:hypothetical protein
MEHIEPFQILLEVDAVDERLVWVEKKRNDLCVKIILRREHGAEGQVINISEIDGVTLLHVSQKLPPRDEARKDIELVQEARPIIDRSRLGMFGKV